MHIPDSSIRDSSDGAHFAELSGRLVGVAGLRASIVFLHGLTFTRAMWDPVIGELLRLDPGLQILALDLPGHGHSAQLPSYDLDLVVDRIASAIQVAGLDTPILVGHSLSAIISTLYAARYPVHSVVNVDQSLQAEGFARFLHSIRDGLRGPGFSQIWPQFAASMHADLLPETMQRLLLESSTPTQSLVLGYWREPLELPPEEIALWIASALAALRGNETPYLLVLGDEPEPDYTAWLLKVLPQAQIRVLPASGHFPHLAHPQEFANLINAQ